MTKTKTEDSLEKKQQDGIVTELDFVDWYRQLETDVLDAGQEDYEYAA